MVRLLLSGMGDDAEQSMSPALMSLTSISDERWRVVFWPAIAQSEGSSSMAIPLIVPVWPPGMTIIWSAIWTLPDVIRPDIETGN